MIYNRGTQMQDVLRKTKSAIKDREKNHSPLFKNYLQSSIEMDRPYRIRTEMSEQPLNKRLQPYQIKRMLTELPTCYQIERTTKRVNTVQNQYRIDISTRHKQTSQPELKEKESKSFHDRSRNLYRYAKITQSAAPESRQQQQIPVKQFNIEDSNIFQCQDIMQFSFGLQQNRQFLRDINRKFNDRRFPREIFLGDVKKAKRLFQQ
ncbi:hypothetical protein pb186bvf_005065 [Paramecium bursaria]